MTADDALAQGFADGIKTAVLPALAQMAARGAPLLAKATPALQGVGRAVVGGGLRAANALGVGQQATSMVRQGLRSSPNFMRNVGLGTGAAALGGAYMAGRAS